MSRTDPQTEAEALVALLPDLARLSRRLSRDRMQAEDLAQEAAARVWAQIVGGAAIDDLRPYLMTAARNLARRPYLPPLPLEDVPEPSAPADAPRRMIAREVLTALARLPRAEARLLALMAEDETTYAEIACDTGIPIGTVMSRISRARAHLRAECGLPPRGPVAAGMLRDDAA